MEKTTKDNPDGRLCKYCKYCTDMFNSDTYTNQPIHRSIEATATRTETNPIGTATHKRAQPVNYTGTTSRTTPSRTTRKERGYSYIEVKEQSEYE